MTSQGLHKTFGGDSWRIRIRQGPASLAPVVFDLDNGLYEVLFLVLEPGFYNATIVLDHTLCDGYRDPPEKYFKNGELKYRPSSTSINFSDIRTSIFWAAVECSQIF